MASMTGLGQKSRNRVRAHRVSSRKTPVTVRVFFQLEDITSRAADLMVEGAKRTGSIWGLGGSLTREEPGSFLGDFNSIM
jgi:hypothetical protein